MNRAWLLSLVLFLCSSCGTDRRANPIPQSSAAAKPSVEVPVSTPVSENSQTSNIGSEETKAVPPAFDDIDFKNSSYPANLSRRKIQLKDGEYVRKEGAGGDTIELRSVDFLDITGDGKPEAIVQLLQVSCGVSCDGGSHLFYFYSIERHRLSTLWRFETGSLGYDCGLKSFALKRERLTLELFRTCRASGSSFRPNYDADEDGGKFRAKSFTRFVFEIKNGRFIKRRRQILPNPDHDIMNYEQQVSISD